MKAREEGEGRRVLARLRCFMVGKGTGEEREWIGLERRDRFVSCGRRLKPVRDEREEMSFEERDRLVRLGLGRAVIVVRLLEAAERVVREGKFFVILTIFEER